jgi:hypothetical protein
MNLASSLGIAADGFFGKTNAWLAYRKVITGFYLLARYMAASCKPLATRFRGKVRASHACLDFCKCCITACGGIIAKRREAAIIRSA